MFLYKIVAALFQRLLSRLFDADVALAAAQFEALVAL